MTKSHDGRRMPYARQAQLKRFFRVSREPVPQNPFQIPVFLWNMLSIGPAPDVRRVKRVPTPEGIQMGCCDHLHACTGSLYRTAPNPVWVVVVHAPVIWRLCHLAASNEREQRRKERQSKRPGPAGPLATKITRSKKHMNLLYIYVYYTHTLHVCHICLHWGGLGYGSKPGEHCQEHFGGSTCVLMSLMAWRGSHRV